MSDLRKDEILGHLHTAHIAATSVNQKWRDDPEEALRCLNVARDSTRNAAELVENSHIVGTRAPETIQKMLRSAEYWISEAYAFRSWPSGETRDSAAKAQDRLNRATGLAQKCDFIKFPSESRG